MLIMVTLNTEEYRKTIGELPETYLSCCIVDALNKSDAITKYWHKAGGTGGFKREEKLALNLFKFQEL